MRDKIWNMIWDLIEEEDREEVCNYEGCVVWEARVNDIVVDIEELAEMIQKRIEEKR